MTALAALGLSPLALNFLARRDIETLNRLLQTAPPELLYQPVWLTPVERWDRQRFSGLALRDIQTRLAAKGLTLRGDSFTAWVNEPVEKLQLLRATHVVRRFRFNTVGDLLARTLDDLISTSSYGEATFRDLRQTLVAQGLYLLDGWPSDPQSEVW